MADTFSIRPNGLFYDLINDRTGMVQVELIDCIGEARNYRDEYTAAALEAEAADQAADRRASRIVVKALTGIGISPRRDQRMAA